VNRPSFQGPAFTGGWPVSCRTAHGVIHCAQRGVGRLVTDFDESSEGDLEQVMSLSPWLGSLAIGLSLGAFGCESSPAVQVLSESTRLARERPSPKESAVFDGKVVRLRGARGETLGVELRISDGRSRVATLSLPSAVATVTGFAVGSLDVREPSTSMYGPSAGRGTYPDILTPVPQPVRTNDLAYFDVAIPGDAAPGRYEGALTVDARTIPAVLDVSCARIDLKDRPLVWVFYAPREVARAHGLPDGDGAELVDKEAQYDALFRAHGAYLASDLPPVRFEARTRMMHDVPYWPVAIDVTSDDTVAASVRQWLGLFANTGVTPFAIPVDEPHTPAEKARARHIAEVIGRSGGGRPRLLRAVTDAESPVYGDAIDVFVSPKDIPTAGAANATERERDAGGERFWTYNGKPPEAGSMVLDAEGSALRTWGWIAERYHVALWYAWEGLYFSDRYNGGTSADVTHDPVTFDERRHGGSDFGNGDGVLAYPGPLPSLRLKVLRRGLQDRLLLEELEALGGAATAREIERRVIPAALGEAGATAGWPTTEVAWERARGQVLDAIEARCR
jgi:hypothetical protein